MREEMKLRAEKPRTRSNGLPASARKRKENQFSLPGFPCLGRRGNCLYTKHKRIIANKQDSFFKSKQDDDGFIQSLTGLLLEEVETRGTK